MGKTADLTVVQKTIIDTLHKEGKPQTFIAKEAGCSQSAVSKHVNIKLSGRKKCGRKRCSTNRENRRLMRIVKHPIQEFGWTSQGMDWGWGQDIKSHHTQTCQGIFPQSVMIWGAMSSAGVGPLFCVGPKSLHPFTKKFWSTSCFLLLTSFLKMLISFSSRIWHLPTLPKEPKVG